MLSSWKRPSMAWIMRLVPLAWSSLTFGREAAGVRWCKTSRERERGKRGREGGREGEKEERREGERGRERERAERRERGETDAYGARYRRDIDRHRDTETQRARSRS
eukprot:1388223-Rhodomonas_salina.1